MNDFGPKMPGELSHARGIVPLRAISFLSAKVFALLFVPVHRG